VRLECGSEVVPHPKGLKRNGRHEETRTPDLYRVNQSQTFTHKNLHGTSRFRKSLKTQVDHNKTSLIVHELCMDGLCPG